MNLFDWLIVGHLVGDFILQTRWMAAKKATEWPPLIAHSAVYTAVLFLFAQMAGGLSFQAAAVIFGSHLLLDKRIFTNYWSQRIASQEANGWLRIMVDQTCHVIVLAVATLI